MGFDRAQQRLGVERLAEDPRGAGRADEVGIVHHLPLLGGVCPVITKIGTLAVLSLALSRQMR
jgi:hypothetical protein